MHPPPKRRVGSSSRLLRRHRSAGGNDTSVVCAISFRSSQQGLSLLAEACSGHCMIHEVARQLAWSISIDSSVKTSRAIASLHPGTTPVRMHDKLNLRRIKPVSYRLCFLMGFLMIVIALAHVIAFEKLNAISSTPDKIDVLGE